MIIAATCEDGQIFRHFGHTGAFKLYRVEDNKVVEEQVIPTMGSGHGALAVTAAIKRKKQHRFGGAVLL